MVADEERKWRRFQGKKFNNKNFLKRIKKTETVTTRHAHKFIIKRLDSIRSVRRQIIGWLLLVGLLITAVGLQLLWFQQSYQTSTSGEGGTFAEAASGPIDTLNPLYATSSAEVSASRLIFSSLYAYDNTGHLQGDLAENMSVDETGKKYTITLRPNVKWHDGYALTAKDIVFTINLIKNPESRSELTATWQNISVKALSDNVVEFELPAIIAPFPHALTFSILPEHILAKVPAGVVRENSFSRAPIGSGPFQFRLLQTSNTSHSHKVVHMVAFDNYYKGKLKLSRFEIHAYDKQDDIYMALLRGEVSAATDVALADIPKIDTLNYNVTHQPINSGVYAILNTNSEFLKDVAVRQALQIGTNTPQIRKSLLTDVPALDSPFVTGQLTGSDIPKAPAFDAAKASELLDTAGWKLENNLRQKDGKKLALNVTTTKNDQYEKALDALAGQWRSLGITINTQVVDTTNSSTDFVQNILQKRNFDVLLSELHIGADPDVYAYWHSSQIGPNGRNFSNYVNPVSDAILVSARTRLEPDLRNAKYKAFSAQWLKDVPAIGLYQPVSEYVSNKYTTVPLPTQLISPYDRYSNILYWSVNQKSVYKTP